MVFDNIATIIVLEYLQPGKSPKPNSLHILFLDVHILIDTKRKEYLWIAVCHLFWDPTFPTVKLLQAKFLIDQIAEFQKTFTKQQEAGVETNHSLVDTGDFNSLPDSAVYRLFATGNVPNSDLAAAKYGIFYPFKHNYSFKSPIAEASVPHTNFTAPFCGCLGMDSSSLSSQDLQSCPR